MTLVTNPIPILEYDTNQKAVIMPNRNEGYTFPRKCVFAFLGDTVDNIALRNNHEKIGEFESITKIYPIYKMIYKGEEVCYCQAPCGSAAATQIVDFLISCGVRELIACGSCGALEDFAENHILVVTEALRDEGTSYHYLPPAREIALDEEGISACIRASERLRIPYTCCKTWTTDGFFRETEEMVGYRKEEGCQVVEMECAALAACARFREVSFGQILFTADSLANTSCYDERDWGRSCYEKVFELSIEAVYELQGELDESYEQTV